MIGEALFVPSAAVVLWAVFLEARAPWWHAEPRAISKGIPQLMAKKHSNSDDDEVSNADHSGVKRKVEDNSVGRKRRRVTKLEQ